MKNIVLETAPRIWFALAILVCGFYPGSDVPLFGTVALGKNIYRDQMVLIVRPTTENTIGIRDPSMKQTYVDTKQIRRRHI